MQVFSSMLSQMLVLFTFMAVGFVFNKKRLLPADDSVVISKLETYIFVPYLVFNTFYKYCTVQNFGLRAGANAVAFGQAGHRALRRPRARKV